jgi:hypothetical protein
MGATFAHGKVQEKNETDAGVGDIHLSGHCGFTRGCCYHFLVQGSPKRRNAVLNAVIGVERERPVNNLTHLPAVFHYL